MTGKEAPFVMLAIGQHTMSQRGEMHRSAWKDDDGNTVIVTHETIYGGATDPVEDDIPPDVYAWGGMNDGADHEQERREYDADMQRAFADLEKAGLIGPQK